MSNRNLRVNELLKREVGGFILRQLGREAVGVTITDVESSGDYKHATVYFSLVVEPARASEVEALLNRHAQAVNQHLRAAITLRNIPRIRFKHDTSMDRGSRILRILDGIDEEQRSRGA